MATLTFAYNHARDPMNPDDLSNKIAVSLALASFPVVDINPTQILVTHPNITSANTSAIQTIINAYVLDTTWTGGPRSALIAKAQAAIDTNIAALALADPTAANNTYIALASPTVAQTNAQVKALSTQNNSLISQLRAITKQNTALIRLLINQLDSIDGT